MRASDASYTAWTDPSLFDTAVLNIALNAQDAMPDGGTFTITLSQTHLLEAPSIAATELRFTDSGCGMSDQVLAQACDPYFTTKPFGSGSGLGLSIVMG